MSKSAKELLESIKTLSNGVKVAPTPASQAALDNIEIRIAQFEENLKNPLPVYLFDGQTAVLTDLRKKRDGLIAGTISIEAAMSVEPLEERTVVVDDLPTEAGVPANAEPTTETPNVSKLSAPQIDPALLAAIVDRKSVV